MKCLSIILTSLLLFVSINNELFAYAKPEKIRDVDMDDQVLNKDIYWLGPIHNGKITLKWDESLNATHYAIDRWKEEGSGWQAVWAVDITQTKKTLTITDVINEGDREWWISVQPFNGSWHNPLHAEGPFTFLDYPIRKDNGNPYLFYSSSSNWNSERIHIKPVDGIGWKWVKPIDEYAIIDWTPQQLRKIYFHGQVVMSLNLEDSESGIKNNNCIVPDSYFFEELTPGDGEISILNIINNGELAFRDDTTRNEFVIDTGDYKTDGKKYALINTRDRVDNRRAFLICLYVDNSAPATVEINEIDIQFRCSEPVDSEKPVSLLSSAGVWWPESEYDPPSIDGEYTGQPIRYYVSFPKGNPPGEDAGSETYYTDPTGWRFIFDYDNGPMNYNQNNGYLQLDRDFNADNGENTNRGKYYMLGIAAEDRVKNRNIWPTDAKRNTDAAIYPHTIYITEPPAHINAVITETLTGASTLSHKITIILDKKKNFLFQGKTANANSDNFAIDGFNLYMYLQDNDIFDGSFQSSDILNDVERETISMDSPGWKLLSEDDDYNIINNNGNLSYTFVLDNHDLPHGRPRFKVETVHLQRYGGNGGVSPVEYNTLSYHFMEKEESADGAGERLANYQALFSVQMEGYENGIPVADTVDRVNPFSDNINEREKIINVLTEDFRLSFDNILNELDGDELKFKVREISKTTDPFVSSMMIGGLDIGKYLTQDEDRYYTLTLEYREEYTENGVTLDGLDNYGIENPVIIKFWYGRSPDYIPVITSVDVPSYIIDPHAVNNITIAVSGDADDISTCLLMVIPGSTIIPGNVTTIDELSAVLNLPYTQISVNSGKDLRNISIPFEAINNTEYKIACRVKSWNGLWSDITVSNVMISDFSRPLITIDKSDIYINDYSEPGNDTAVLLNSVVIDFSITDERESLELEYYLLNTSGEVFIPNNVMIIDQSQYGQPLSFEIPSGSILDYGYNELYVRITEPEPGGADRITEQFIRNLIINRAPVVMLEYTAVNPGEEIDLMDYIWIQDEGFVYTPDKKGSSIHYAFEYEWRADEDSDGNADMIQNNDAKFTFANLNFDGVHIVVSVTDPHGKTSTAESLLFVMPTRYGYLKGNETWAMYTENGQPGNMYAIIGDIYTLDFTLTVTESVEVIVMGNYGIYIQQGGTLIADTCSTFRFRNDLGSGKRLYWKGIKAEDGGNIDLSTVTVDGAERGVTIDEVPGTLETTAKIGNSTFSNNLTGIHVLGKELLITYCTFINNRHYALKEDAGADFDLLNCTFQTNGLDRSADGSGDYYDYYDCQSRTVIRAIDVNRNE